MRTIWITLGLAGALVAAGLAAGAGRQDIDVALDDLALARVSFVTTYSGNNAALLRAAADAIGDGDGAVSEAEASNVTARAAGEMEGRTSPRAFLDGFPATQGLVTSQAQGLAGPLNAPADVTMRTDLRWVFPVMPQGRHVLMLLPAQDGALTLTPPAGWTLARLQGAEAMRTGSGLTVPLARDRPVMIELVSDAAGGTTTTSTQGGKTVPDVGGFGVVVAAAAAAGLAVAARRRR